MQVGADDVVGTGALGPVPAVVAVPGAHAAEGRDPRGQRRQTGVVLVADDPAEALRLQGDVPDQAPAAGHGLGVEDRDAGDLPAGAGDEAASEELVEPADDEHGHAVAGPRAQLRAAGGQVLLDALLPGVLAAAAHEEVDVLRELVAGVVGQQVDVVARPLRAARQDQGVAPVAVDVHVSRVELQQAQAPAGGALGGVRVGRLAHVRASSTSVSSARWARRASMAV